MVTDQQVRILMKAMKSEKTQALAAAKAGMDVKTARKYVQEDRLPSDLPTRSRLQFGCEVDLQPLR